MPLSIKQLNDYCLLFSGDHTQCRYLAEEDDGNWYCLKKKKADRDTIDNRILKFVSDCAQKGIDPTSQNIPMGDNCAGYPILKFIEQGHDCP